MGQVGTGKTSVARQLGRELDWPVFSSDRIRKMLAGVPLTERTPRKRRGELYSKSMTKQTYKELWAQGLAALEAHRGVVLDATFSSRADREFLRQKCTESNVRLQMVELDANPAEVELRLKAREQSMGEISDARVEDLKKLNAAYESPSELSPDLIKVSANDSVSDAVKAVLLRLSEKQLQ